MDAAIQPLSKAPPSFRRFVVMDVARIPFRRFLAIPPAHIDDVEGTLLDRPVSCNVLLQARLRVPDPVLFLPFTRFATRTELPHCGLSSAIEDMRCADDGHIWPGRIFFDAIIILGESPLRVGLDSSAIMESQAGRTRVTVVLLVAQVRTGNAQDTGKSDGEEALTDLLRGQHRSRFPSRWARWCEEDQSFIRSKRRVLWSLSKAQPTYPTAIDKVEMVTEVITR